MIPLFKVHMPESVMGPLKEVLLSGYIGQGPKVDEFERQLVKWVGNPNCLTLNSGTSALHLALRLAGVGPGTEVISVPMTCSATNTPIVDSRADIVWADIDPWDACIDPTDVERKITPRTKAIMAVHWGGYPCDLDALIKICLKYKVALIEDAAHAFGSTYKGRPIGNHSSYVCFSFQAIKVLTTIDGGLLVCPSVEDYRLGKLLRWYGIDRETPRRDLRCENDIVQCGYKYHMNDVCAVIGLEQLKYVDGLLARQKANAAFYDKAFSGLRKVKLLRYQQDRKSGYWLYTIRVDDRESYQEWMKTQDVMVSQVHVRNDIHTAFKSYRRNLPGVDEFAAQQVSIPVGWWVTDENREKIVKATLEWDTK